MEEFTQGLAEAWAAVAAFVPKLIAFLLILVVGYFVAKALQKVTDGVLERVGFDRWVERGGIKAALARTQYDASSILARVVFYALMLFVLQLAFGIFGPNPVSDLIQGVIAYLPNVFAAIVILVVAAAIAAGVRDIVGAALSGFSYGRGLAVTAAGAVLVLGIFAALDQLQIAPTIVNTLFVGLVVLIVGSGVVAIGGGGIQTMSRYWERASQRVERESDRVRGSEDEIRQRAQQQVEHRREQARSEAHAGSGAGTGSDRPQASDSSG